MTKVEICSNLSFSNRIPLSLRVKFAIQFEELMRELNMPYV